MVGGLEPRLLRPGLVGSVAGQDSGDVEDDGCLLEGERVLGGRFMGEGVEPIKQTVRNAILPERFRAGQSAPPTM